MACAYNERLGHQKNENKQRGNSPPLGLGIRRRHVCLFGSQLRAHGRKHKVAQCYGQSVSNALQFEKPHDDGFGSPNVAFQAQAKPTRRIAGLLKRCSEKSVCQAARPYSQGQRKKDAVVSIKDRLVTSKCWHP